MGLDELLQRFADKFCIESVKGSNLEFFKTKFIIKNSIFTKIVQYVTSLVSIDSLYSKEFIETNIIGFDQE
jgi:hypothetical protein